MSVRYFISALCSAAMVAAIGTFSSAQVPASGEGQAMLEIDGRLRISSDGAPDIVVTPIMANPSWQFASVKPKSYHQEGDTRQFVLSVSGMSVSGDAVASAADGAVNAQWTFVAGDSEVKLNAIGVGIELAASSVIGGRWSAGDRSGTFPAEMDQMHLFRGRVREVSASRDGLQLTIQFPEPTPVLIQDNRQWGQTFSIRIGRESGQMAAGEKFELPMTIKVASPVTVDVDSPIKIVAGDDWIPLNTQLEIEPGSALDFSHFGFAQGPCGKDGWVIVNKDGHFAFENNPDQPVRFYGVNFCFSAQYLSKEEVDKLCDRLVRLGYNTVRIHHYEGALMGNKPGFEWNLEALDQLDYLMAACKKRGLYVTTDLFVSRPISSEQVQYDGRVTMNHYKVLIPVHEPAFEDFKKFSRYLLEHVNPYTGVRWADEPTLAWISMVNEGNFGNYWNEVRSIPQWTAAWNRWLAAKYADRAALVAAWGEELKEDEDPASGSVSLPGHHSGETPRHRDCALFLADTETEMYSRMVKFVRDELKCRALFTNMNAWTNHAPNQLPRVLYDYVDDHFYVDHPQFLEQSWRLPSRCDNENPVRKGATGGSGASTVRMYGKPFTISEYNYSGPGRFRGVGGILTGARAALQDWDVIWRFAYSHNRDNLFKPSPMGYFDLATDPLNQAADRAAVMLYLRGDLRPATNQVALVLTPQDLKNPPNRVPGITWGPTWLSWVTRLGSVVVDDPSQAPEGAIPLFANWNSRAEEGLGAFRPDSKKLVALMREKGIISPDNPTDPSRNIFQSETGEVLIDGTRGVLQFDTLKTAGGYADPGEQIVASRAGVRVSDMSIGATVFVTSLDSNPIRSSSRLLVTHLTDLQNTETHYAERARQTLLAWGKMPHLVRAGTAKVQIEGENAGQWKVYSLSTSGQRIGEVPAEVDGNTLTFTCDVKGPDGARMLYEVVRQ